MEDKIKCKHCGTEFDESLLANKNSLDRCLVCGEFFEDAVTCSECNTTFKRELWEKQKDKEVCPVCGEKIGGASGKVGEKISKGWELAYSTRDIKRLNGVALVCRKCDSAPTVPVDKFEILTPEQCKLKKGEVVHCEEDGCKNTLTSDYIVLAEDPVEPETHIITCPTCGSSNVKKIGIMKKAGAVALLDLLSAGYVSKTFECKHCGMTF